MAMSPARYAVIVAVVCVGLATLAGITDDESLWMTWSSLVAACTVLALPVGRGRAQELTRRPHDRRIWTGLAVMAVFAGALHVGAPAFLGLAATGVLVYLSVLTMIAVVRHWRYGGQATPPL